MKRHYVLALAVGMLGVPAASVMLAHARSDTGIRAVQFLPDPGPQLPSHRTCTAERKKLLEAQMDAWKQIQRLSRGDGERMCSLVENADELGKLDGKTIERMLPEKPKALLRALGVDFDKMDVRAALKELGYDLSNIDLRAVKAQCRQMQGDADRLATSELGRLRNELLLCDGSI